MAESTGQRLMGLSPKARHFVLPFLALSVILVVATALTARNDVGPQGGGGPVVGGDLHAVAQIGNRSFVGGHGGAGFGPVTGSGSWTQIDSLDETDVMGWASTGAGSVLAAGHAGLYESTDDGATFVAVANLPVSDVHAVGAYRGRVYLASPQSGILVSTDGGRTFTPASSTGQDFMGTIWVDQANPDIAIAPSMMSGAVKTTDGGATWSPLGTASGTMAVAVDTAGQHLVAIGMDGAQQSSDAGKTWTPLTVPTNTTTAAYTSNGTLLIAVLVGDRAAVYRSDAGQWMPLT